MVEKIFKRADGTRVKVTMDISHLSLTRGVFNVSCLVCAPKKRTFKAIINQDSWEYRSLTMDERERFRMQEIMKVVTKEELDSVKVALLEEINKWDYRIPY